jgi:hypothetical protein
MKLLLSAIRTSPPLDCFVGADDPSRKINGWGGTFPPLLTAGAVRCQIAGQGPLEDPEILQRNLGERLGWNAKILGEHLGRGVGEPVRHQQRIEFVGVAVVEADHELTAVRAEPLQRMRLACREIPQVALINVSDVGPAHGVENRHAATAVSHDRPLCGLMPVQFPDSTGGQPHVDA